MQYPQWFFKGGQVPHKMHSSIVRTDAVSKHAVVRFPLGCQKVSRCAFCLEICLIFAVWFMSDRKTTFFSAKGLMCVLNVMTSSLRSWWCEFVFVLQERIQLKSTGAGTTRALREWCLFWTALRRRRTWRWRVWSSTRPCSIRSSARFPSLFWPTTRTNLLPALYKR